MHSGLFLLRLICIRSGGLSAADSKEVKGKVKKVDADKSVIVIVVDGKDVEYAVAKDAKFTQAPAAKKSKKNATPSELTGGRKAVKEDAQVVLTTEAKDGKDVVTALKVEAAAKEKKKKKDK